MLLKGKQNPWDPCGSDAATLLHIKLIEPLITTEVATSHYQSGQSLLEWVIMRSVKVNLVYFVSLPCLRGGYLAYCGEVLHNCSE